MPRAKKRNKSKGQTQKNSESRQGHGRLRGGPFIRSPSSPCSGPCSTPLRAESKEAGFQGAMDHENQCGMQTSSGIPYSRFIHGLKLQNIGLDRKSLADMAVKSDGSERLSRRSKGRTHKGFLPGPEVPVFKRVPGRYGREDRRRNPGRVGSDRRPRPAEVGCRR